MAAEKGRVSPNPLVRSAQVPSRAWSPPPAVLPLPSLVLALRMGTGWGTCWGLMASGGAMVTVSTAAATAAAAAAAELPLKGLLALNSRHLAPRTVIILDMGIFGFLLAMSGLCWEKQPGHEGRAVPSPSPAASSSSPMFPGQRNQVERRTGKHKAKTRVHPRHSCSLLHSW